MNNKVNRQQTTDNGHWLKSLVFGLLSLAMITSANAQQLQSYTDKNYNEKVQTVLFHPTLDSLAKPIIYLNDMMGMLHLHMDLSFICIIPLYIVTTIGRSSRTFSR